MIRVRAPNGAIIQFPDGTAPGQINQVMGQYHAQTLAAADAGQRAASTPGVVRALNNGFTGNFMPEIDATGAAAETGLHNFFSHLTGQRDSGYGMADAFHAVQQAEDQSRAKFADQHPVLNVASNVVGAVANPVNRAAARFVGSATSVPSAMLRSGAVGTPIAAAYGAGAAGPGHRVQGAIQGAAIGGPVAAVLPGVSAVAGKAGGIVQGAVGSAKRFVGAASPTATAQQRLAAALLKDTKAGVDPAANLANWPGNSSPTLADVGGENLRGVVRDAASQGPARQVAQSYRDQVAADLQDHAQAITQRLTAGETRSPQQLAQALTETRGTNAAVNYAEPYAAPISLTDPNVIQALRDPEGASAINRAIAGARSNMDYGAAADLQGLKATAAGPTGDVQVWPTTGRALDRVQIAFGNRGAQLMQGGSRDIGAGMFKRQALVNALLDDTPGLSEARADYRNLSQQIDAIDHGQKVASAPPSALADALKGTTPDHLGAAGVGARDALMTAIGGPTEGAIGRLNTLSTNTNTGQNMGLIYGPDATQNWRDAIQAEAGRMSNANYVAPNTGSQTFGKAQDASHNILASVLHAPLAIAGHVLKGVPLSDAEREAIVNPAIGNLSPDLIAALLKAKAAQPMLPGTGYFTGPAAAVAATAGAQ